MITFNLYNNFTVGLEGEGLVYERVRSTLRHFQHSEHEVPDITIHSSSETQTPQTRRLLGAPKEHYATGDGEFVFIKYGNSITVNKDFTSILASSTAPPDFVRLLMEWRIRERMVSEGFSMVHSSGVKYNGETYIFPAWRHTGKTNIMLTFLQKGAHYLGDDRLFIGADGTVRGYPTDLHLLSYNYRSFPELAPRSPLSKIRGKFSKAVNGVTSQRSCIISKGINLMNDAIIAENQWYAIEDMFPKSKTILQTDLNKIMLLTTTTSEEPHLVAIDDSDLTAALCAINYREWDKHLLQAGLSHRVLTGNKSFENSVHNLIEEQKRVLDSVPDSVEIQMLCVPREEYWRPEMKQKIFDYVTAS
jgi:hypothetical protein